MQFDDEGREQIVPLIFVNRISLFFVADMEYVSQNAYKYGPGETFSDNFFFCIRRSSSIKIYSLVCTSKVFIASFFHAVSLES